MKRVLVLLAVSLLVLVASASNCWAKTFIIPHILEKAGNITNTQNTFDTVLYVTYAGGLAGIPSATGSNIVNLYLYNANAPLRSATGASVCNPCNFSVGATQRKFNITIDDRIVAAGGFPSPVLNNVWGIVVVTGGGVDKVNLEGAIINARSGPNDLSFWGFKPQPVGWAKNSVIPHMLEKAGAVSSITNTFDTTLYVTYAAGLANIPFTTGNEALVNLYLYNGNAPLKSRTGALVCNPCQFLLNTTQRKFSIRIEDWIVAAGGFPSTPYTKLWGIVVVSGDVEAVNMEGVIINSHSSLTDLSFWGFDPQIL